jgi:hypothetical protein
MIQATDDGYNDTGGTRIWIRKRLDVKATIWTRRVNAK